MAPQEKDTPHRRRTPRQKRSRDLVETVVAAGLEILESEGPTGLTVRAVCDRAGVSAGSVYQYFETKEAVIEAVYRGQLARDWQANLEDLSAAMATLPLRDVVIRGVHFACERELHLFDLHPGFYRRYAHRLSLGGNPGAGNEIADALRAVLSERRSEFRVRDIDSAVFLLAWGLAAVLRTALVERPDSLRDPAFQRELADMVACYLLGDEVEKP